MYVHGLTTSTQVHNTERTVVAGSYQSLAFCTGVSLHSWCFRKLSRALFTAIHSLNLKNLYQHISIFSPY